LRGDQAAANALATYERKYAKWEAATEHANALFCVAAARLLKRLAYAGCIEVASAPHDTAFIHGAFRMPKFDVSGGHFFCPDALMTSLSRSRQCRIDERPNQSERILT